MALGRLIGKVVDRPALSLATLVVSAIAAILFVIVLNQQATIRETAQRVAVVQKRLTANRIEATRNSCNSAEQIIRSVRNLLETQIAQSKSPVIRQLFRDLPQRVFDESIARSQRQLASIPDRDCTAEVGKVIAASTPPGG